jgi:hypothetical protein
MPIGLIYCYPLVKINLKAFLTHSTRLHVDRGHLASIAGRPALLHLLRFPALLALGVADRRSRSLLWTEQESVSVGGTTRGDSVALGGRQTEAACQLVWRFRLVVLR